VVDKPVYNPKKRDVLSTRTHKTNTNKTIRKLRRIQIHTTYKDSNHLQQIAMVLTAVM